jgi:hypothetical protein
VAIAYGVFIALNPLLYEAPLRLTVAQVEAWNLKFAGHWKARPEASLRTLGVRARAVGRVIAGESFGTLGYPYVTALLAVVGALVLVRRRRRSPEERSLAAVLLVWSAVTVAIVTAWIPLDWDRYYLPVIAVVALLGGAAVGVLARVRPEDQGSCAQRNPT